MIFLVAGDWLQFFICNVSKRKNIIGATKEKPAANWLSTKFRLLHIRCVVLKHWAQMIELLWLTVLLHALSVDFKHITVNIEIFLAKNKKTKTCCDNLA